MNRTSLVIVCLLIGFNQLNAQQKNPGINLDYMDRTVKPGDDFFRFVNGTWYDNTEIPGDKTRWGSFDELRQSTDQDALAILKEAVANKKLDPNSDQAKAVKIFQMP